MLPRARVSLAAVACVVAVLAGAAADAADRWRGFTDSGTVTRGTSKQWELKLPPGNYEFVLSGTGDADLYVRIGAAPTMQTWDCRPSKADSNERCFVHLAQAASVHVMVLGHATSSAFKVVGRGTRPR